MRKWWRKWWKRIKDTGDLRVVVPSGALQIMADRTIVVPTALRETQQATQWIGEGLSGELGAIAKNDSHATTTYEYTRQHAPTIPTIPTPTGDVSAEIAAGVNTANPNASDEYLAFTWDSALETAYNAGTDGNPTYRVIFFAKGFNADGTGASITTGGSAGTPRWFVYWDTDTPSNVQDIKPWNLAEGNRAVVKAMRQVGADYIYFVGLDFTPDIFGRQEGSNNITYYRCMSGQFGIPCVGSTGSNSSNDLTIFECYASSSYRADGVDVAFIGNVAPTLRCKVISCEAKDLQGDFVQWDTNGKPDGCIVEDCDYYRTLFMDGSGNESSDDTQSYCRGEGFVDVKDVASPLTSTWSIQVLGNRVWKQRAQDPTFSAGGLDSGIPVNLSRGERVKAKIQVKHNVFHDILSDGVSLFSGAHLAGHEGFEVSENLISQIKGKSLYTISVLFVPVDDSQIINNTTVDNLDATSGIAYFRQSPATMNDHTMQNNAFIDSPPAPNGITFTANLDATCVFNYNAFIGSGETYETPTSGTNYVEATKSNLNFGNFTYKRKKLTGAETHTINGVVPTNSTPSGFLNGAV